MLVLVALTVACSIVGTEAVGYAVHRLAHKSWTRLLYRSHLRHHAVYPPADYLSDEYRVGPSFARWYMVLGLVFGTLALVFLPLYLAVVTIVTISSVGFVEDYAHGAFHIRGHWLENFERFKRLRESHRVHHANVRKNLAICAPWCDRVLKTYEEDC